MPKNQITLFAERLHELQIEFGFAFSGTAKVMDLRHIDENTRRKRWITCVDLVEYDRESNQLKRIGTVDIVND